MMHSAFRFGWIIIIVVSGLWPPLAVLAAIVWESIFGPTSGEVVESSLFVVFAICMSMNSIPAMCLKPDEQTVGRVLRLMLPGAAASAAICLTTGILLRIAWEETNDINSRSAVGLLLGALTSAAMYVTYRLIGRSRTMQALAGKPSDAIANQQR